MSSAIDYLPILFTLVAALGFVVTTMVVTHSIGPKRGTDVKLNPFECGIESQGNARIPFSIKYFLVAILFVLFDVEIIFMYPWAVNFKQWVADGQGPLMFVEMLLFIGFVLAGFYYVMRKGALKWE
jgi:NADH-quinone oxidoreductase subunit A